MYKVAIFRSEGYEDATGRTFETKEAAQEVAASLEVMGVPFLVVTEDFLRKCRPVSSAGLEQGTSNSQVGGSNPPRGIPIDPAVWNLWKQSFGKDS